MARNKIEADYKVKKNDILEFAQRFIMSKGYDQMSIQDIIQDLGISKGAFYHYFKSKSELLDGLTDKLVVSSMSIVQPIVDDPSLPAIEKFQVLFNTIANYKTANRVLLMQLLRVWYADENAILRQKLLLFSKKEIAPLISKIVHQGINEGTFNPKRKEMFGEIYMTLLQDLGDSIALLILDEKSDHPPEKLQQMVDTYTSVITDLLGAPEGSICLIEPKMLEQWALLSDELPSSKASHVSKSIEEKRL